MQGQGLGGSRGYGSVARAQGQAWPAVTKQRQGAARRGAAYFLALCPPPLLSAVCCLLSAVPPTSPRMHSLSGLSGLVLWLAQVILADPQDGSAHFSLGTALAANGQLDHALMSLDASIVLVCATPWPLRRSAVLYSALLCSAYCVMRLF